MLNSEVQENYYRVKFANVPHEVYAYGDNYKTAIWNALDDLLDAGQPEPLGNASARLAVYKEWNYSTWRYTNGGNFIREAQCNECAKPMNPEVHREELGLCLECSDAYWSHSDN